MAGVFLVLGVDAHPAPHPFTRAGEGREGLVKIGITNQAKASKTKASAWSLDREDIRLCVKSAKPSKSFGVVSDVSSYRFSTLIMNFKLKAQLTVCSAADD